MNLPVYFTNFPKIKYKEMSVEGFTSGETKGLDIVFAWVLMHLEHPNIQYSFQHLVIISDYMSNIIPTISGHSTDLILWAWNFCYPNFIE